MDIAQMEEGSGRAETFPFMDSFSLSFLYNATCS